MLEIYIYINYSSGCMILIKLKFSKKNLKNTQILKFMKIRSVRDELFHADGRADGQTDMSKLKSRLPQFFERAKNQ
jgi:hypothetical protein